ncbi:hypothetical protein [uncultured Friedmanniella sp.]|uniref:hypothetical protein n=1 Tax=uncultured Friedmanniella sp. TaxID=335381 RepID=UPI0035CB2217
MTGRAGAALEVEAADVTPPADDDLIFTGTSPFPASPVPRFGDDVWSLDFFDANPTSNPATIHWADIGATFRPHLKLAAWALLNLPFPDEMRRAHAPQIRQTLGAFSVYRTVTRWKLLTRWLDGRGVTDLNKLTSTLMGDYLTYERVERGLAANSLGNDMTAVLRLWVIGQQLPAVALAGRPPWLGGGQQDYLATNMRGGENITEPIAAATMGALLHRALQMVEHGTEPVLTAYRFRKIPETVAAEKAAAGDRRRDGAARLDAYLDHLRATGAPIPARHGGHGVAIDVLHVACLNQVTLDSAHAWAKRDDVVRYATGHRYSPARRVEVKVPLELDAEAAQILPAAVMVDEILTLVSLLEAACFIVIAYLTGMRTGEVLALEAGCLRPSSRDGGWMLIHSRHFKSVRDEHGNHDSRGEVRGTPWVAVAPVVQAIRALEALRGGRGLLFPATWKCLRKQDSRSRSRHAMVASVTRFVDHLNARQAGTVPDDPNGTISPIRFRRTLAWHLANEPRGLVALAIQYGHLHTAISEGYASRTKDGLQELVDFETARSIAVRLSQAREDLSSGEGVSGPAAASFVAALDEQHEQFNGIVTSQRQAASLLRNQRLTVFQNEKTFLWCHFRRDAALCLSPAEPGSTTTPRLDKCRPTCGNVARTDSQATQLRDEAGRLGHQAELMPKPAADRLTAHADTLTTHADRHDAERQTLEDFDGPR